MEEGRQRKQELEQPARWVLPQTPRTHLSVTGYSRSQNRWPGVSLVPSVTLLSLGGPYIKTPVCALCTPASNPPSPGLLISEAELPTEGRLSTLQGDVAFPKLVEPCPRAPEVSSSQWGRAGTTARENTELGKAGVT